MAFAAAAGIAVMPIDNVGQSGTREFAPQARRDALAGASPKGTWRFRRAKSCNQLYAENRQKANGNSGDKDS